MSDGGVGDATVVDWKQLKLGQHIRLKCGCEGFVTEIDLPNGDPDQYPGDVGFVVTYTREFCQGKQSCEDSYQRGYGPYSNFFNHGSQDEYGPYVVVQPPAWWKQISLKRGWPEVPNKYPVVQTRLT